MPGTDVMQAVRDLSQFFVSSAVHQHKFKFPIFVYAIGEAGSMREEVYNALNEPPKKVYDHMPTDNFTFLPSVLIATSEGQEQITASVQWDREQRPHITPGK